MIAYDINKDSNVRYSIVSSIRKYGSVGKDKEKSRQDEHLQMINNQTSWKECPTDQKILIITK